MKETINFGVLPFMETPICVCMILYGYSPGGSMYIAPVFCNLDPQPARPQLALEGTRLSAIDRVRVSIAVEFPHRTATKRTKNHPGIVQASILG